VPCASIDLARDRQLQAARQADDRFHDGDNIGIIADIVHEGLVDFQYVERKVLEIGKR